jgi:hypothetical protein
MRGYIAGSAALGALLVLGGMRCAPGSGKTTVTPMTTSTPFVYDQAKLKLDSLPYQTGVLIMGGTPYAIKLDLKKETKDGDFSFLVNLNKEGTKVEEERYHIDDATFQYRGSEHETFDPPLTLINFPLKDSATSDWDGELDWGGMKFKASAKISTKADPLNLQSGKIDDAIMILVALDIKEPGGNVATKELKFWVAPDRGLVRRDFAATSSREPAAEPTQDE